MMTAKTSNGTPSDNAAGAPPRMNGFARLAVSPWMWLTLVTLGLAVALVYRQMHKHATPQLPVLGQIPVFSLSDQHGKPVTGNDYRGKVWIADFIFLGCTQSCPKLTGRMASLQERIGSREQQRGEPLPIKLVSFSVDPTNDTPERLQAYADKFKADGSRWSFLTGQNEDVDKIVVQGFKMQYGKVDEGAGVFAIMHGDWFILVDAKGNLRGYYESSEPAQIEKLMSDAERLVDDSQG